MHKPTAYTTNDTEARTTAVASVCVYVTNRRSHITLHKPTVHTTNDTEARTTAVA